MEQPCGPIYMLEMADYRDGAQVSGCQALEMGFEGAGWL